MIKDINLAPSGKQKIAWVKEYMPLLNLLNEKYSKEQIFKGLNMVVTIHLEAKTAYLAQVLKNAGANVVVTGSNPLSTQDDVAAALVKYWDIPVLGYAGESVETYNFRELILEAVTASTVIVTVFKASETAAAVVIVATEAEFLRPALTYDHWLLLLFQLAILHLKPLCVTLHVEVYELILPLL